MLLTSKLLNESSLFVWANRTPRNKLQAELESHLYKQNALVARRCARMLAREMKKMWGISHTVGGMKQE